jgi:hypothetical protein
MDKWQRQAKKRKAEERAKAFQRRKDIKSAVTALTKVLPHFGRNLYWHKEVSNGVQRALNLLAGQVALP